MRAVPLNRKVLVNRLSEIERDVAELTKFQDLSFKEFAKGVHFAPGQRPETYKAIALGLGQYKVVPEAFARGPLQEIAGYRNRLIHFYDEITSKELYDIIQNNLKDLETFAKALRAIITHPERVGLGIR